MLAKGSHEAANRGAIRKAQAPRGDARKLRGGLREALFTLAGSRLDGRRHALPMRLVDRMESLKDWKAEPKRRGYGAAAGNSGETKKKPVRSGDSIR